MTHDILLYAGRVALIYVAIAAGEYTYHRWVAHQLPHGHLRSLPFWRKRHRKHMRHHCQFYRCYNFEPDPLGRYLDLTVSLLTSVALISLLTAAMYMIDETLAIMAAAAGTLHTLLFNLVHSEVHLNRFQWIRRLRLFRYWERQHCLHHWHMDKNYDGVAPLFDLLMGTLAVPTPAEIDNMSALLGYDCRRYYRRRLAMMT